MLLLHSPLNRTKIEVILSPIYSQTLLKALFHFNRLEGTRVHRPNLNITDLVAAKHLFFFQEKVLIADRRTTAMAGPIFTLQPLRSAKF